MAVYDRVDDIDAALDSIRAQDYPAIELVVFDGGSTDGTLDRLEARRDEIDVFHSGPDAGIYDAWNKALERATGSWVLFLGSDDRYANPTAISRLVARAGADPEANLVVGRAALVNVDGSVGARIGTAWGRRRMHLCMAIAHPACLTARSLIDEFGPFSTSVGVAADYDLYLRANASVRALDLPEVVVLFSIGGVSSTNVMRVFRSVREVQAGYPGIGPIRAHAQYLGFRVALPLRTWLRRVRPSHEVAPPAAR